MKYILPANETVQYAASLVYWSTKKSVANLLTCQMRFLPFVELLLTCSSTFVVKRLDLYPGWAVVKDMTRRSRMTCIFHRRQLTTACCQGFQLIKFQFRSYA